MKRLAILCALAPPRGARGRGAGSVARNVVGDVNRAGTAIPVCAGSDYDASTQEAIRLINAHTGFGRTLFSWARAPIVTSDPEVALRTTC